MLQPPVGAGKIMTGRPRFSAHFATHRPTRDAAVSRQAD